MRECDKVGRFDATVTQFINNLFIEIDLKYKKRKIQRTLINNT